MEDSPLSKIRDRQFNLNNQGYTGKSKNVVSLYFLGKLCGQNHLGKSIKNEEYQTMFVISVQRFQR
jgi:hypothetical protein